MNRVALGLLPCFAMLPLAAAIAEEVEPKLDAVEVIAVSPLQVGGVDINKIPANVQTVSADELQEAQALSLADYMNRYLGSVNINDAQNNPLQPDVQYRGYSASPLMGVPQGMAAYVNGVRFNEPFGDMINWDLIPQGAIESMSLQPASNPAFGLNALGGSFNIKTKTGFSAPKHVLEVQGGSWDRHTEELSTGWNNGTWGYFADFSNFSEAGWRDHSRTEAKRGFGTLSWRGNESSLDLNFAGTDNAMRGNGAVPEELLAFGRDQVFTHPDITRNRLFMVSLDGDTWLNQSNQLSGTAYYRRNKISTFNGDGSEAGACVGDVFLCDEAGGDPGLDNDGLADLAGNEILASDALAGGTINTSETTQQSFGFALQNAFHHKVFGLNNQLLGGASYDHSTAHYQADTELGSLTANRGVAAGGVKLLESHVRLNTETNNYGVFLTDTLSVTDKLDVTVSGRYNITHLKLKDQFPDETSLSGYHTFNRINPAAGLTYAFQPELTFYGNYSESSRVPTPMELSCADRANPCKLPNAFVADPPLAQVVANTWEAGFRGDFKRLPFEGNVHWNAGFFHVINNNDILWQGNGAVNGMGFFENVGKTQRQGAEAGLDGAFFENRWRWSAHYTFIDATYQASFATPNAAHPNADVDGLTQVRPGNRIPGIPAHQAKFSTDVDIFKQWTLGFDMNFNSSQFLRGDEANLTGKIPAFVVFNLHSEYRFSENVALFGRVNNLFDREYSNFGALGATGDVLDGLGINNANARFVGVGAPRAAWVGIRLSM